MAEDPCDGELERFLAERGGPLLRAAVLLTGSKEIWYQSGNEEDPAKPQAGGRQGWTR
jgi:hypothetical protein